VLVGEVAEFGLVIEHGLDGPVLERIALVEAVDSLHNI
jgi:hypothetical protein